MASIRELHQQLVSKARSAVEITTETLQRIETLEPKLHSFLCVTADNAIASAKNHSNTITTKTKAFSYLDLSSRPF